MINKTIKFLQHFENDTLYVEGMCIKKLSETTFSFYDAEEDLCLCTVENDMIKLEDESYTFDEFVDLVTGGDEDEGEISGWLKAIEADDSLIEIHIPKLTKVELTDEEIELIKEGIEDLMNPLENPKGYEVITGLLEKIK